MSTPACLPACFQEYGVRVRKPAFFTLFATFFAFTLSEGLRAEPLSPTASGQQSFLVFDGTQYENKPNLLAFGIRPVNIVYVSSFWNDWHNHPPGRDELPDRKVVEQIANQSSKSGMLTVIDIEHWPLRGDEKTVESSVVKYSTVLRWFKAAAPGIRIGLFGALPIPDYHRAQKSLQDSDYKKWQAENDRLAPLAKEVDVIFPAIYTYFPDQVAWREFAVANIREARRYGKPVYVFLWPQYSERNKKLAHRLLPSDYWQLQLKTVHEYADGLVIWGGWDSARWQPAIWDEDAHWWWQTKQFMKELYTTNRHPSRETNNR